MRLKTYAQECPPNLFCMEYEKDNSRYDYLLRWSTKYRKLQPKNYPIKWALDAHRTGNGCPSLVLQLPSTCSPVARHVFTMGLCSFLYLVCSFLYLVDYIVSYSYCKLTIIFSIPNSTCQSSILFLVSIYILPMS